MSDIEFDHVGIAVTDAGAALAALNRLGLLLPVAGEVDDEFRYVIGGRERADEGIRVELLDPNNDEAGFLARFLRGHGEGAHHLTFMAADLDDTCRRLATAGIDTVQADLSYPPWREIFVHPASGLGTVVQIGSSVHTYPVLDGTTRKDPVPHRRSGRDRSWWRAVVPGEPTVRAVAVREAVLGVADLAAARTVFGTVLRGRESPLPERTGFRYEWRSGALEVAKTARTGISALRVGQQAQTRSTVEFAIGDTRFLEEA